MTLTPKTTRRIHGGWVAAGMLLTALLLPGPALAQRTNATVNVEVSEEGRPAQNGVTVTAFNTNTGAAARATPRGDGTHVLPGLPPGEYLITAMPANGREASRLVKLEVGQTMNLGIDLAERAPVIEGETVMVEGRLTDATSSEIAVNVTREQIENLPQMNRNFLSFAQLAPGVRINDDEFRKDVQAGALTARQTNVFIDGVSLKNNVLEGGVIGQDASRGNPFPQLAVDGFRVLSQNFKAEYEQAGAAVITATTRSGGNDFHADVFTTFQNKNLVARDYFALQRGDQQPDLARYQLGGAVSGPVLKDKLFFFLSYEGNLHNRANQVAIKDAGRVTDPVLLETLRSYEGQFISPFREHLGFGKLSWRLEDNQLFEVSGSLRRESDIRSFGDINSYENAEDVRINTTTALAKHQWWLGSALNEVALQFLHGQWNPAVLNTDKPGLLYEEVLKIGGRDTSQDINQYSYTIRDDLSLSDLEWGGHHFVKTGARVSLQDYRAATYLFGNPRFKFRSAENFAFPYEAEYGVGDPLVQDRNVQIGLYAQDDWQPTKRLTLNAGVRWDVETNAFNNYHKTPDNVRAAVTAWAPSIAAAIGPDYFPVDKYLTDGTQRPPFLGAIQPRIGFTYDVLGNESTILFGGAGRYYDRTLFVYARGERERLNFDKLTFRFSADGSPRGGDETIAWQPGYTPTKELLDSLIAQGDAPQKEIWLLKNDTRPPHSDMYSIGVRQHAGPLNASLTFTHIGSENDFGWYVVNRHPDTKLKLPPPAGFGDVIISSNDRESRYTSLQLAVEKPFSTVGSTGFLRWGASLAYTLGYAFQRGDGFYMAEFPDPRTNAWREADFDERHRLVFSAVTAWPYEITLSTMVRLGSGTPYNIVDESAGTDPWLKVIERNATRPDGLINFSQIDLRLAKEFTVARRHRMGAFAEVFNLLNTRNFGDYDTIQYRKGGVVNPMFGEPKKLIGLTRSLQAGVNYSF